MTPHRVPIPIESAIILAIHFIRSQSITPDSPGDRTDAGAVRYCAGAAVAAAGLIIEGDLKKLDEFEDAIASPSASKRSIQEVFLQFGWPLNLCNQIIAKNDSLDRSSRTEQVVDYLRRIASDSATRMKFGWT